MYLIQASKLSPLVSPLGFTLTCCPGSPVWGNKCVYWMCLIYII